MEFCRQKYWNGEPFPSPGHLPKPGVEPRSPALQADSLLSEPPGKPLVPEYVVHFVNLTSIPSLSLRQSKIHLTSFSKKFHNKRGWTTIFLLVNHSVSKESACSAGDLGSIPGLERSPGEGNGNPLQYSCLENPMDRGAWWAAVHGVTKSWARLSN